MILWYFWMVVAKEADGMVKQTTDAENRKRDVFYNYPRKLTKKAEMEALARQGEG